jgi:hypothetical protein
MPRQRVAQFRLFCSKALGTGREAPLRDVNGATIAALVEAFRECFPKPPIAKRSSELPDFSAEIYCAPFTAYVIRNRFTKECYIGVSTKGFVSRYSNGEWWIHTHNDRLKRDAIMYGVRNFDIAIHAGNNRRDMEQIEAMLLRANRPATYNERPEPDTVKVGHEADDDEE